MVQVWNRGAEQLWGLREDETRQQSFFGLDIGLPVQDLRDGVRTCLNGSDTAVEQVLAATNRRGRAVNVRVLTTPFIGADGVARGVVLLMDEVDRS